MPIGIWPKNTAKLPSAYIDFNIILSLPWAVICNKPIITPPNPNQIWFGKNTGNR